MLFPPGATSVSIDIRIVDDSGLPVTGLLAATFPTVKYSLAGPNADATITLADLATITTAWASGGVKERGEGVYRLDLPDAALASAGKVTIRGEASGKRVLCEVIEVDYAEVDVQQWKGATAPANTGDAFARLGAPAGASVSADIAAIQSDLNDLGLGTGARTVTITVNDGSNPLESARVRVTKGAETYVGNTNASGQITFFVNDGTWAVAIVLVGYSFAGANLVVDGAETVTYSMSSLSFSASDPGKTTGYLYCYSEDHVVKANVEVNLVAREAPDEGLALSTTVRTEISDANGLVQFTNLIKGATYRIYRGTRGVAKSVTIPTSAGSTYQLPSIVGN